MKFLPIVWRNLLRRKFRTIFTIGAIFFAFLLFGVLMAIRSAFNMEGFFGSRIPDPGSRIPDPGSRCDHTNLSQCVDRRNAGDSPDTASLGHHERVLVRVERFLPRRDASSHEAGR